VGGIVERRKKKKSRKREIDGVYNEPQTKKKKREKKRKIRKGEIASPCQRASHKDR
jgi:hypothetical protein